MHRKFTRADAKTFIRDHKFSAFVAKNSKNKSKIKQVSRRVYFTALAKSLFSRNEADLETLKGINAQLKEHFWNTRTAPRFGVEENPEKEDVLSDIEAKLDAMEHTPEEEAMAEFAVNLEYLIGENPENKDNKVTFHAGDKSVTFDHEAAKHISNSVNVLTDYIRELQRSIGLQGDASSEDKEEINAIGDAFNNLNGATIIHLKSFID